MVSTTPYKLICEMPDPSRMDPLQILYEEESLHKERALYLTGPYLGSEIINRNNRLYPAEELRREVNRYTEEKIKFGRALGELNHPESASVDLGAACHLVVELKEDNNVWYGKSKVLVGTPKGDLLKSLLNNGVQVGMSSRCLGQLTETSEGYSRVSNLRMIAIDAVSDPSFSSAYVDGILESAQFVCESDGSIRMEKLYDDTSKKFANLPVGDRNDYIKRSVIDFLKSFNEITTNCK